MDDMLNGFVRNLVLGFLLWFFLGTVVWSTQAVFLGAVGGLVTGLLPFVLLGLGLMLRGLGETLKELGND